MKLVLKYSLFILSFVFAIGKCSSLHAQSADELWKNANKLYKDTQYTEAAHTYQKIVSEGYKNAEVYYNLGNCYYKLNDISKAIINYERALKLAPKDEDIQHNLKIANTLVIDKIVPVPQLRLIGWWDSLLAMNSAKGWGNLAMIFMWLALIVLAVYLFIGLKQLTLTFSTLFIILSLAFVSLGFKQGESEQSSDAAILTVSNVFVKSAPDANGNDQFMLHEGVKFQLLDKVGDWNKIRLADGKVGWVEHGNFEKI